MDTTNIIIGSVSARGYTVTAPIVKEDYGIYLKIEGVELPTSYEVDFSNDEKNGTSVTMIGNADGVLIPSQFIGTGKDIFAFLYHVGEDFGRTVYKFRIPNKVRPDRTDEEPTPEEQSVIDQTISALNEAVAQTAQDVIDADASAQASAESAQASGESALSASNSALSSGEYASNALGYAESASASATASANSASASAQIKADVEELVDDAQGYAESASQSATASANSATTAQGYAQGASSSAQSASDYASQAQTSANTASAKAQDASQSATTASQKATESAQSASRALGYKTDAESAKVASQTAQGLAESARDSAISAKTDAEQAKADAESARDEAQSAVASISGALADKAPIITDTASGAIASFPDGADDLPLKSLVVNINPVQDLSNGDPSPENICPISGWTGVTVQRTGKNLFDESIFANNGGVLQDSGMYYFANIAPLLNKVFYENNGYTGQLSITLTRQTDENRQSLRAIIWYTDGTTEKVGNQFATGGVDTYTVVTSAGKVVSKITGDFGSNLDTYAKLQIELGSTATDYHPYTGRSITIDLGQTVYGGKLDVLSGELVIDRTMVDLGTLDWVYRSTGYNTKPFYAPLTNALLPPQSTIIIPALCSMYPQIAPDKMNTPTNDKCFGIGHYFSGQHEIQILDTAYTDATAFKAAVTGQTFVYKLAEPIEIQLSANQINSLLGVNNLWADSGDTEVEYRADTKLFIERLTAPDSADMVADANITSGKYFMVGNSLYKATANIANGSAIIVGTNCTRKSLSEALNEINV